MEKGLRISYLGLLPIVVLLQYVLLKNKGGMAMGVLLIFFFTGIPFLLINIARCFDNILIRKTLIVVDILYLLIISVYSVLYIKVEGLVIFSIAILITALMILEIKKNRFSLLLNWLSIIHLLLFLVYVSL